MNCWAAETRQQWATFAMTPRASHHSFLFQALEGLKSLVIYFLTFLHLLQIWLATCTRGFYHNHIYLEAQGLDQEEFDKFKGAYGF